MGMMEGDYSRLEKKKTAWSLIWPTSSKRLPPIETLSIQLKMPPDLAERWKNFVFLSPS